MNIILFRKLRSLWIMLLIAVVSTQSVNGQGYMTDEEILQFAVQQKATGSSDQDIAMMLVQRGVGLARLQEVYAKLRKSNNAMNMGGIGDAKMQSPVKARSVQPAQPEQKAEEKKEAPKSETPENNRENEIFGHDVFASSTVKFEVNQNVPIPDDYRLGAGDKVIIEIYGDTQRTIEAQITSDGVILVPTYGPLRLSGMTIEKATAFVRDALSKQYANSKIQLFVGDTKSIVIQVMGEVKTPGTYTLSAFASVFHALYRAGGPNNIGTLRQIKVFRNGKNVATVDVYDYILNGNLSGDITLQNNDVVVVSPYNSLVRIVGKVKRPMYYELKDGETLGNLVQYAGGFTGDAYTEEVCLIRNTGVEKQIFSVDNKSLNEFKLADRDSVFVDKILERFANRVEIKGAVFRAGAYQLGERIKTVKDLVNAAKGPTEIAFLNQVVLHRRKADKTLESLAINLTDILEDKAPDIELQKDDELFVPTRRDMMFSRMVSIHGEVFNPGDYPYAENQTLESLVMLAGGMTDNASTVRVDVSRRILNPDAATADSTKAQWFTFGIKDGFIVEGQQGFVLMPYDDVFVRRSPMSFKQQNVTVQGKVAFEGSYSLTKEGLRLSDLVKMAGGPTIGAYTHGARLVRKINDYERIRMQEVLDKMRSDYVMLREEDKQNSASSDYSEKLKVFEFGDVYYVGIELDKALANPGCEADIPLREGDELIVPEYTGTVTISGEVQQGNTVAYLPGKRIRHYVDMAGGYTQHAKKRYAYIMHMNGTISKARRRGIEAGCEIVVPIKSLRRRMSMAELLAIGSSSASFATMIATVANIIKN